MGYTPTCRISVLNIWRQQRTDAGSDHGSVVLPSTRDRREEAEARETSRWSAARRAHDGLSSADAADPRAHPSVAGAAGTGGTRAAMARRRRRAAAVRHDHAT